MPDPIEKISGLSGAPGDSASSIQLTPAHRVFGREVPCLLQEGGEHCQWHEVGPGAGPFEILRSSALRLRNLGHRISGKPGLICPSLRSRSLSLILLSLIYTRLGGHDNRREQSLRRSGNSGKLGRLRDCERLGACRSIRGWSEARLRAQRREPPRMWNWRRSAAR